MILDFQKAKEDADVAGSVWFREGGNWNPHHAGGWPGVRVVTERNLEAQAQKVIEVLTPWLTHAPDCKGMDKEGAYHSDDGCDCGLDEAVDNFTRGTK